MVRGKPDVHQHEQEQSCEHWRQHDQQPFIKIPYEVRNHRKISYPKSTTVIWTDSSDQRCSKGMTAPYQLQQKNSAKRHIGRQNSMNTRAICCPLSNTHPKPGCSTEQIWSNLKTSRENQQSRSCQQIEITKKRSVFWGSHHFVLLRKFTTCSPRLVWLTIGFIPSKMMKMRALRRQGKWRKNIS